ncbi:MAG: transposase [Candidatus Eisenbacteria bacterium]|nr:transposase [Candidatus Eisenbacteria bacterium]
MIEAFDALWEQARPAFRQERTWQRARTLALSALVGLGRRTITGLLTTCAQQGRDWSASYRLFEQERFDADALFTPARRAVGARLAEGLPLVVSMDDTLVRKRGRRVHGTGWKRDPLGLAFRPNFVWGQRFLQISAALPESTALCRARGVPIDLVHSPSPRKPRKRSSESDWDAYHQLQQSMKLSSVSVARLRHLRAAMDADPEHAGRSLIAAVDGSFTNREVFRSLPERTTLIGRIRKDARLFLPPSQPCTPRRGRRSYYGAALPTPEEIRLDESTQWIPVQAWAAGQLHLFSVKTLPAVRWAGTGGKDARLVIIRPLAYRPRKGAHLLYRSPAYLLCTDPHLSLEQLLQAYLWRWEIEVNFRDEKTLLGVGEAQVRTRASVENVPSLLVAAYAFMLLAGTREKSLDLPTIPLPKWRRVMPGDRTTTNRLIGYLRAQLWGKGMGANMSHFVNTHQADTKPTLFADSLPQAVCYAFR